MVQRTIIVLALVAAVLATYPKTNPLPKSTIAHFEKKADVAAYRLPTSIVPISYDILLEPDFASSAFNGHVVIIAQVSASTSNITLHQRDLTIGTVKVEGPAGEITSTVGGDLEKDFLIINLDSALSAGQVTITIDYVGVLSEDNDGFYKAFYTDANGNERMLVTTQFESTSAREAFPCFDEPALKAKFKISIIRDSTMNAISNTPLVNSGPGPELGTVLDEFRETETMSTYLIAFVVSDFKFVQDSAKIHEVYARPQFIDQGQAEYALSLSEPIMTAMKDFTGIENYLNGKMTQIAIPNNYFAAGAMENWGLVTYREQYLLFDEGVSTPADKQLIAQVVAHEYGHQWFGDMVSPDWWTYIWLNEGFATYFEFYAASVAEPDWRMMEQFVVLTMQLVLRYDADELTRPMTYEAGSPQEIENLFDLIAYHKSGSVIRMFEHIVTTDVFKAGLNLYLQDRYLKAATEDDLWRNAQAAIDAGGVVLPAPIGTIMKTWTLQAGYPVVSVTRNADGTISLSQKRFFNSNESSSDTLWYIPINFVTADDVADDGSIPAFEDTTPMAWLSEKNSVLPSLTLEAGKWIILNKHSTSYYRINYDEGLWSAIITLLKSPDFTRIPPVNRAQILDDAFNLAQAGQLSFETLMSLLEYVTQETDMIPLYSYYEGIGGLFKYLDHFEQASLFAQMNKELLKTIYQKVGQVENDKQDTHIDKLNRMNVLQWMCYFGDEDCLSKMNALLKKEVIPEGMKESAYCLGMMNGGEEEMGKLLEIYNSDKTEELEKEMIIKGIGCTRNDDLLWRMLNGSIVVRKEDKMSLWSAVYTGNDVGLATTVVYVYTSYETIPSDELVDVLTDISSKVVLDEQIELIKTLLDKVDNKVVPSDVKDLVKTNMEETKKWIAKYEKTIDGWLSTKYNVKPDKPGSASIVTLNGLLLVAVLTFTKYLC